MKKILIELYNDIRWWFINFLYDFDAYITTSYEDEPFDPTWMDYGRWKESRYVPKHF